MADRLDQQQNLNDFGAASFESWSKLVERDLQGAAFEKKLVKRVAGIAVRPLYTEQDVSANAAAELPGFAPFTRGGSALGAVEAGWDLRPEIREADPQHAGRAVLDGLNGGATSIALRFDLAAHATSAGLRSRAEPRASTLRSRAEPRASTDQAEHGIAARDLVDLASVLGAVDLATTPVALSAGASGFSYAAGLIALAKQRGTPLVGLSGCFGLDPLTTLARDGQLGSSLDQALNDAASLARFALRETPHARALHVDTSAYHDAGADAATEIALALASGVEYLRALTARQLTLDDALAQLQFGFSIGRDFFLEIAKLRAARRAWARVASAAGGSEAQAAMLIHARTSLRETSRRDPWVNLLRGTAESFAAAVGGANVITTHGFDAALGASDAFAERMARNTQHLLRDEANIHRVVDPAGGSYYVEALTEQLCARAWALFQGIEREGGLTRALLAGSVQAQLERALEETELSVETRKIAITGVNEFPNLREAALARGAARFEPRLQPAPAASSAAALTRLARAEDRLLAAVEALSEGASFLEVQHALSAGSEPVRAVPLVRRRLAAPFEALRDRADAHLASTGARPRAFLANLGPIAEHKARAAYAQNVFEAGGFETLSNDGFASAAQVAEAFAASGAEIAVLCGSDALYAELAESSAQALANAKASAIVLAGNPGEREASYQAAGVSDFAFVGANLVTILSALLTRAGVA